MRYFEVSSVHSNFVKIINIILKLIALMRASLVYTLFFFLIILVKFWLGSSVGRAVD